MAEPTLIDLFSGCGGISAGFAEAGYQVLAGVELLPRPLEVFRSNFPRAAALNADLSAVQPRWLADRIGVAPGELDVLVGGPPCQGWSKNTPASKRRLDDGRNQLMLTYLDFVTFLRPKVVLIENVAELINAYGATVSDLLVARLEAEGYSAKLHREIATDYGVAQRRRRVIIAGTLNGAPPIPRMNQDEFQQEEVTVWDAISDLPSLGIGEQSDVYAGPPMSPFQTWARKSGRPLADHFARRLTENQMRRVRLLPPGSGAGLKDLPEHVRPKMGYSGAYARLWHDEPARTITKWVFHPGSGRFLHPFDDRVITIREAARLQGFPDWFTFSGTYIEKAHMVGEAVPPLMAYAWALGVKDALGID